MRRTRHIRASVLVILMVTLLFASFALIAFIERATNDLLVDQREAETVRLRREAYSALEVTLAVLEDFREVGNGLHSPAEGWNDPLAWAGYLPAEDRTIEVASIGRDLPRNELHNTPRNIEHWVSHLDLRNARSHDRFAQFFPKRPNLDNEPA